MFPAFEKMEYNPGERNHSLERWFEGSLTMSMSESMMMTMMNWSRCAEKLSRCLRPFSLYLEKNILFLISEISLGVCVVIYYRYYRIFLFILEKYYCFLSKKNEFIYYYNTINCW